jgi:hypothetical protein
MTSWPHIRSLLLASPRFYTPTITFRGLFTALHQCPRLHTLDISLDNVNIDIDHTSFQHASLQELILATSRISDAEAVARIVFSVFPSVDQFLQDSSAPLVAVSRSRGVVNLLGLGHCGILVALVAVSMPRFILIL